MRYSLGAARIGLGALFVYAALTKLPNLAAFAEEVANYRLLPPAMAPGLAAALPGIELVAGLLLCLNRGVRAASLVIGGMLGIFVIALTLALGRGIDLRCGCFGGSELATWSDVVRDVVLAGICAWVGWKGGGPVPRGPGTP